MQVIIISGQAKSGKSLVASEVAEAVFKLGYLPVIDNFAAPIKEEAAAVGLDKEKDHDSFRRFCQDFGRMKREEDPDYFVTEAAKRLAAISEEEANDIAEGRKHWERVVIYDDCRYPNECKFGKAIDAILVFVSRGNNLPDPNAEWRDHESEHMSRIVDSAGFETHFDEIFDVYVVNDGPKKRLKKMINNNVDSWLSYHPAFSCEAEECNCPLCVARRENRIPDPADVMEYIIRKLTGDSLSPEQLDKLEDQIQKGKNPAIDIDFMISFEDDDDESEYEDDEEYGKF